MAEDFDEGMTKQKLLAMIREAWEKWESALNSMSLEQRKESGVTGRWTVKDTVAHITWFEREMIGMLRKRSLEKASPLWELPRDERNQKIYDENRNQPEGVVFADAARVHAALLQLIEALDEEDLHDPKRLGLPDDWVPWQVIAENTSLHYADHTEEVKAWAREKDR